MKGLVFPFFLLFNKIYGKILSGEMKKQMKRLNLVLVEPQIPQNTGNIARTCAATGASLHLVRPLGFEIDDKKLKRAGLDYWNLLDIHYYNDVEDFFTKNPSAACYFFTTKGTHIYSDITYPEEVFLVFGREDAGLDEGLLYSHPDRCLRLPMIAEARSLNLSNSVAVAAFVVLRQWGFPTLKTAGNLTKYRW